MTAERGGEMERAVASLARAMAEMSAMLQSQAERQTATLEDLAAQQAGRGGRPPAPFAGVVLQKMTEADDPLAFLDTFEAVAEACDWPGAEWAVRLLPLLSGEAQMAALALPAAARATYGQVRRAVMDRLGRSPEDYRRRFRELKLGPTDRPYTFAHQLHDAAVRWLRPGETEGEKRVVQQIVLEQFVQGLPTRTAAWVRCHRPGTLQEAITLAEDHLAVHPAAAAAAGPAARPIPAPRRRFAAAGGPPTNNHASPFSPPQSSHPVPPAPADPAGAPQTPGQGCWRCGQPGHIRRECPLMEVGQVIRVAGPPASSPDSGGTYRVP
ncbi:zinc finger protein 213-like [Cololabis saira]|uniref:zinc finger protein 213-like n=1 Tax=Cololabis saira TaxID=129043 RepID=UPI002AD54FF9|nr:zinc finger protein 213-like [Cololabis saira]